MTFLLSWETVQVFAGRKKIRYSPALEPFGDKARGFLSVGGVEREERERGEREQLFNEKKKEKEKKSPTFLPSVFSLSLFFFHFQGKKGFRVYVGVRNPLLHFQLLQFVLFTFLSNTWKKRFLSGKPRRDTGTDRGVNCSGILSEFSGRLERRLILQRSSLWEEEEEGLVSLPRRFFFAATARKRSCASPLLSPILLHSLPTLALSLFFASLSLSSFFTRASAKKEEEEEWVPVSKGERRPQ